MANTKQQLDEFDRLSAAAERGLSPGDRTTRAFDGRRAGPAKRVYELLGIRIAGYDSTDEELADFTDRLEASQDAILYDRHREWQQHIYYCGGLQYITYHRDRRQFLMRRTLPWRIRCQYNIMGKAQNLRVSRLTENKPAVSVQAKTADRDDVEKAEYKESLFWYLWDRLYLHAKITRARRWAFKCGSGLLKTGWDAEAGEYYPATIKQPKYAEVLEPVEPNDAGEDAESPVMGEQGESLTPPMMQTGDMGPLAGGMPGMDGMAAPTHRIKQVAVGVEEFYVNDKKQVTGPCFEDVQGKDGTIEQRRLPPPDGTAFLYQGEACCEVIPPFEGLWDPYVEDPSDSWYFQHRRILPLSKIAALYPDAIEKIKEAKQADSDGRAVRWSGLMMRGLMADEGGTNYDRVAGGSGEEMGYIDREYKVVETWIYPKDENLRRLWGERGALVTTVGGVVVDKKPLPSWASRACNFILLPEESEEGNHYGKAPARDIVPLQDDINRTLSTAAEDFQLRSRLLLGAPQNHGLNLRVLGGLPGMLVTYRSAEHKPEPIQFGRASEGWGNLLSAFLSAANDLGNMNDASTGKLPSAGIAAKAVYALQYADERSITEASNLQDLALKRLAESLDAITRAEYTERRKIRIVGADRSFMVEQDIDPEMIAVDVDYTFSPGSMMSRQKDAVKNEMLELKKEGLLPATTVLKHLASAVPDVFRLEYDLQYAHARRMLSSILKVKEGPLPQPQPQPWEDAGVHAQVLQEFMLTSKYTDFTSDEQRSLIAQLWQTYTLMAQGVAPGGPPKTPGAPNGAPPGPPMPAPDGGMPPGGPIGADGAGMQPAAGAEQLDARATQAMEQKGPPGAQPAAA